MQRPPATSALGIYDSMVADSGAAMNLYAGKPTQIGHGIAEPIVDQYANAPTDAEAAIMVLGTDPQQVGHIGYAGAR